jgi:hypothetical protein
VKSRYKKVKRGGRTFNAHRLVMERHLGRPILATEHVHHINGDRFDNRVENLEVRDGRDHVAEHAEERRIYPREKTCVICGRVFTPHRTKRKRARTCSPACANKLRSVTERRTKALVRANVVEQRKERAA